MTAPAPEPIRLPLAGLPASCRTCGETPETWPLTVYGHQVSAACPRCWTAVAPVVAVAAEPGGHYHDATGYEDTACHCPSPLTYAPQWPEAGTARNGEGL